MSAEYINGKPVNIPEEEGLEIAPEDQYLLPPEEKIEAPEIGIIRELNPKSNLEDFKNEILGKIWDNEKKKYDQIGKALMSEMGAGRLVTSLMGAVSSLTTFSNYSDEGMILKNIKYTSKTIILTVHMDYEEFGIKNKCDLPLISQLIYNFVNSSFRKALGAGERNLLKGVVSEQIRSGTVLQPSREKKSVWSKLSPFGRR